MIRSKNMKRAFLAFTLALIFLTGSTAFAEHGDWSYKGGGEGLFMMDAFGIDETTVIFSGMNQSGALDIDFAWKSQDTGLSLTTLLGSTFGGDNICEMLALMEIATTADFGDSSNGLLLGIGFPQDCIDECEGMDEIQAFAQMIICMLQASTKVTYTHDGGDNWDSVVLDGGADTMFATVDMVTGDVGYAAGDTTNLSKTDDGGETWTGLPNTDFGFSTAMVNYIYFLDESVGYLGTGNWESEDDKGQSHYEKRVHLRKMRSDPAYGLTWNHARSKTKDTKAFNADGGIWKTVDGGQTFERLFESYEEAVVAVSFFDELHGVIVTDKLNMTILSNYSVYYTIDGGVTWTVGALPGPLPDLPAIGTQKYNITDVHMAGKKLVYLAGAADAGFGQAYSVIFFSEDGGVTWQEDLNYNYFGSARQGAGLMMMGWMNGNFGWVAGMGFERALYTAENFGPVADAGEDAAYEAGDPAVLYGAESYDDNGDPLTYTWEQLSGPDAGAFDVSLEISEFTPAETGDYVFKLTVSDGVLDDNDEVAYTVTDPSGQIDADDAPDDDDDNGDDDDSGSGDDDDDDDGGCCG